MSKNEKKNVFITDEVLQSDEICNLESELKKLKLIIKNNKKAVIYGRRNSGKTSLIQASLLPWFKENYKKSFVLNVDLLDVKDWDSISLRFQKSFESALAETFPIKTIFEKITQLATGLTPTVEIDPLSNLPTLSLQVNNKSKKLDALDILRICREKIFVDLAGLIILDEFQDIAHIAEAEAKLRTEFQKTKKLPILILGSKKHLLAKIFANPNAPFADFGVDILFSDLPYKEYYNYCMERLKGNKLTLSFENCQIWQDLMFRNAEAMNRVGQHLLENYSHCEIDEMKIRKTIFNIVESRRSRFEEYLGHFSAKEQKYLKTIAELGQLKEKSSIEIQRLSTLSHTSCLKYFNYFLDKAIIERIDDFYRLTDPFLHYSLLKFR
jgi:AAA+ ATPase superfamily predicted ATPase